MSPAEMRKSCEDIIASYREMDIPPEKANVTLVTPAGFKKPKGFPRGYLLQVKDDGRRIWHFNAVRVLNWLTVAEAA